MSIDKHAIEKHVRGILLALGADIEREGLIDTPKRVANMYEELFDGMKYSNQEIADMFNKTFEEDLHLTDCTNDMVIMRDIEVFSHCEHHMALMYDMKITVAYIPNNKILGLSKIARIADMASKRLQIQERLGADIAEIIMLAAKTKDVAVLIEAYHSCVSARGIKKKSSKTYTQTLRGRFNKDATLLESLRQNK